MHNVVTIFILKSALNGGCDALFFLIVGLYPVKNSISNKKKCLAGPDFVNWDLIGLLWFANAVISCE